MSSSATIDSPNESKNTAATISEPSANSKPCFQLKGALVPMTTIELTRFDELQFAKELAEKTQQAPDFFENLPVVIGLEKYNSAEAPSFESILNTCANFSIRVVAVRGGSDSLQELASKAGLAILAKQKEKSSETTASPNSTPNNLSENNSNPAPASEQPAQVETVEVVKTIVEKQQQVSKVIQHPIRSGQQVYASDGDLIVLASVSAGAEILADGNIHVYGALRGRALAGVKGDTSARIFCHSLAAELVSIAGQYKISEDIDRNAINKPAQAYLEDDKLKFKPLTLN